MINHSIRKVDTIMLQICERVCNVCGKTFKANYIKFGEYSIIQQLCDECVENQNKYEIHHGRDIVIHDCTENSGLLDFEVFDFFKPDLNQENAYNKLSDVSFRINNKLDLEKNTALLVGACGTGKTILAVQFALSIINKLSRKLKDSTLQDISRRGEYIFTPVKILSAIKLRDMMRNQQIDGGSIENLREYDVQALIIDDLGSEGKSESYLSSLLALIDHRNIKNLFTLFTTNLTPKEIGLQYGNRIYDRIKQHSEVYVIQGESKRKQ